MARAVPDYCNTTSGPSLEVKEGEFHEFTYFESRMFSPEEDELSEKVIAAAEDLALQMKAINPSRERSLAITKLEETVMWANRAIAIQE